MMQMQGMPVALARLVEMLSSLPGVGAKTALRLGLNLLSRPAADATQLAEAIGRLHQEVCFCERCGCFSEQGHCQFCDDPRRDGSTVCLVEQPVDVLIMERGHSYRGVYHVLHGRLSPVDGVGPNELKLVELDRRVASGDISELILATSATVDGEATAHYLARRFSDVTNADDEANAADVGIRISRIARGVPEGGELEYLDEHTLARAMHQRVSWDAES